MSKTLFTTEEVSNILALIEMGARTISSQNPIDKAGEVLMVANTLMEKVKLLNQTGESSVN
jgi:hypothetical protein